MNETISEKLERVAQRQREIEDQLRDTKSKKFKLPLKARVGNKKAKLGYATVIYFGEGRSIDWKKEPIIDNTVKDSRRNQDFKVHAVDPSKLYFHKGKPVIFQPDKKLVNQDPQQDKDMLEGDNQTYGQKYVMARMLNEALKLKKTINAIGWWIFILGIVGIGAYYFMKSKGAA